MRNTKHETALPEDFLDPRPISILSHTRRRRRLDGRDLGGRDGKAASGTRHEVVRLEDFKREHEARQYREHAAREDGGDVGQLKRPGSEVPHEEGRRDDARLILQERTDAMAGAFEGQNRTSNLPL